MVFVCAYAAGERQSILSMASPPQFRAVQDEARIGMVMDKEGSV